jgi:hypothetical protein
MSYDLRVPRSVHSQIEQYLTTHRDPNVKWLAAMEIGRELGKLAKNPRLGTSPPGLFEARPVYQFPLEVGDGPRRIAQAVYQVVENEGAIVITGFEIVGLASR